MTNPSAEDMAVADRMAAFYQRLVGRGVRPEDATEITIGYMAMDQVPPPKEDTDAPHAR